MNGGAFVGDFRLFLGTSRSLKTVKCLSFCELVSIDVEKFQSLMSDALPELFDILVIYSAIDHDCPKAMLHCLEEQGLSPEMPLLFGEGVLHHCAKVNAVSCAERFIQHLGDRSRDAALVLDQEGKTPAQLAAALKHKDTFWSILLCSGGSSSVTDADVFPQATHAVHAKHKQMAVPPTWAAEQGEQLYTAAKVRELFNSCNVHSCVTFGQDGRKSMEDLVAELNSCQSELVVLKQSLLRRVRMVRLRLLAVIDGSACVLAELQSDSWLKAPDQKLAKLPGRRLQRHETEQEATQKLMKELGLAPDLLEEDLVIPLAKTCHVEIRTSMSYPGFETEYTVFESTWKIRAQALLHAKEIGLPTGKPFMSKLWTPSFRVVHRQFFWPVLCNVYLSENATEAPATLDHEERDSGSGSWVVNPLRGLLRAQQN